mgnify:CR=1 FL=1
MNEPLDFPDYSAKRVTQQLAFSRFDTAQNLWRDAEATHEDVHRESLACVTFNTWFQGAEPELRYAGLLDVLRKSNADVIVLQEATTRLVDAIMQTQRVRREYGYARAPFRIDTIPSHGVMMLSKLPLQSALLHPLPTHMGRNLLVAECRINGQRFVFATAHLESMKPYADVRGEQLKAIFALLDDAPNVIFAGDFNFCSSWLEENSRIDKRYADIWAVLRPDDPGYTQDPDLNRMLALTKRARRKVRIDRILLRSDAHPPLWKPATAHLLGVQAVSNQYPAIFASDHFGVAATIVL